VTRPPDERGERRRLRGADVPAAVHWHEGMLLVPQHFQLASHREEALVQYHVSVASPYHWGLIDFERKFNDGVLTISKLEAVLPDGLVVSYPRDDGRADAALSIDLKPLLAQLPQGQQQTIFLSVAARIAGERFTQRYELGDDDVADETTGIDPLKVQTLRAKLQLIVADYLPESSVGFPVARFAVQSGAPVMLEFEPPWLTVRSSSPIHRLCSHLADDLRTKARSLATSIANNSASTHGPQMLETRMLIHSLVSGLIPLEALLDSNVAHPFTLYMSLAAVAGNLAPGQVPQKLERYDHDDPLRAFRRAIASIEATMKAAIRAPYTLHPFTVEGDAFRLRINPTWVGRPLMLGVRAPAGVTAQDVDDWVVKSTIGPASTIESLRIRRVSGLKRERVVDSEVVPAAGVTFYTLKQQGEHLVPSEDLVIVNPDKTRRPDEIVLYVNTEA
jgi:type VI secretion system protein ImpJ